MSNWNAGLRAGGGRRVWAFSTTARSQRKCPGERGRAKPGSIVTSVAMGTNRVSALGSSLTSLRWHDNEAPTYCVPEPVLNAEVVTDPDGEGSQRGNYKAG